jgi:hypothetical protein
MVSYRHSIRQVTLILIVTGCNREVAGGRDARKIDDARSARKITPAPGLDGKAMSAVFRQVVSLYLSTEHREEKTDGCPVVTLASDAARQGSDVKESFEAGIRTYLEILGRLIAETEGEEPNGKTMVILSTMVGALTLSRAVNDSNLAQAFLDRAVVHLRETTG